MGDTWESIAADEVRVGDRIRVPNGDEVFVSRIEENFFGQKGMFAFIEDTDERWFKQPAPGGMTFEVRR